MEFELIEPSAGTATSEYFIEWLHLSMEFELIEPSAGTATI
jgi:hypothetical protein